MIQEDGTEVLEERPEDLTYLQTMEDDEAAAAAKAAEAAKAQEGSEVNMQQGTHALGSD